MKKQLSIEGCFSYNIVCGINNKSKIVRRLYMELLYYLIFMNVFAFIIYGVDKRRAIKKNWRISEQFLLTLALLGGGISSFLGMRVFRHKTQTMKFRVGVPLLTILSVIMIILLVRILEWNLLS